MNSPGESKTSKRRLSAVERQAQALDLRRAGANYRQIAEALGYAGPAGAYKAVNAALKKTLQEPAEEVRKLELDRLDALLMGLWPKAVSGDTWSVDRVLAIMERRAKLIGLDAPTKIDINTFLTEEARRLAEQYDITYAEALAEAEAIVKEAQKQRR